MTLCTFYFCILILTPTSHFCCLSKKAPFLLLEELRLCNITRTCSVSTALLSTPSSNLRLATSLQSGGSHTYNFNIHGDPIASDTHTHPSHLQRSRLLATSLSLGIIPFPRGVPFPRGIPLTRGLHIVCARLSPRQALALRLSLLQIHPYLYIPPTSRYNQQKALSLYPPIIKN